MLILRLDALHPAGDGVFCLFFHPDRDRTARARAEGLQICGWEVDLYEEDLGPLDVDRRHFLLQNAWPQLPTSQLLEWFPLYLPAEIDAEEVYEMQEGRA